MLRVNTLGLVFGVLLALGAGSCNREAASVPAAGISDPMAGSWITDCMDMGGGALNQIYAFVGDGVNEVAILTHANVGCTGGYTMTDSQGNPVTEPAAENTATAVSVSGIPTGFHVYRIAPLSNPASVGYVVFYRVAGSHFNELIGNFTTGHTQWSDWLNEPDVAGFAADPANYVPSGGGMILTFRATSGLP